MELIKRNIHMDRIRAEAVTQITLEDDINLPENKPDVEAVNLEKGEVIIDEVKAAAGTVHVRGRLIFCILYRTMESGSSLVAQEGKIPFEEKMNLQGASSSDTIVVDGKVEDLNIGIINSRKLSVQSVVTLHAQIEEIYDEELPIDIKGEENVEYRRRQMKLAQIAICKNDIFRMKEEISLPTGYPNIFQILWTTLVLQDVEFKLQNEKIVLQGDVQIFVLYEGEGEDHPIRSFETTLPLSGTLECAGCYEGMLPDIRYTLGQQEVTVRPDFDGEERNIGIELAMEIAVRIYEEEAVEILSDIYGVNQEVEAVNRNAELRRLLTRVTGKTKVTDHVKTGSGVSVLQLLHSEGQVSLDEKSVVENGILLQGCLTVKMMFITGDDAMPYVSSQVMLPYEYTLEIPGITPADMGKVQAEVEQLQVNMLDGEEVDVKAVLGFTTTVFQTICMELMEDINVSEIDGGKLAGLPGMVIYMVQPGDNLWNIGKKYYVSVDNLRELNGLTGDEVKTGQKLLIVKG